MLLSLSLLGCETQPTHEVLNLTEVTPRQVEPGDRMVVEGAGFPTGADVQRVTVQLTGALSRPGAAPCPRPVTFTLTDPPVSTVFDLGGDVTARQVQVVGGDRLEFVMTPAMLRALTTCPGERAAAPVSHATLSLTGARGGVQVRFETAQGTVLSAARPLRGPRLDLHTGEGRALDAEQSARVTAERTLDDVGVQLAAVQPPEGGLLVERVRPGSAAEEAGVSDGDVMLRMDGLSLLALTDFRPAAGAERVTLTVRHGDATEDRALRVGRLAPSLAADLLATVVLLLVTLGVLQGARGGVPATVRWLHAALAPGRPSRPSWASLRAWMRSGAWRPSPGGGALALAALATTALAVPFGPLLFELDPDAVVVALFTSLASLWMAAVIARAEQGVGERTTMTRAVLRRAAPELVAVLTTLSVVTLTGAVHVHAIVDAQGAAPWQWNLFRNPGLCAVGMFSLLVPAFEVDGRDALGVPERALRGALVFAQCALLTATLLGGWRLPGVGPGEHDEAAAYQMLGALVFFAKAWGLAAATAWSGARLRAVHPAVRARVSLTPMLPLAALVFALHGGVTFMLPRVPYETLDVLARVTSWTTFALTLAGMIAWLLVRPRRAARGLAGA